MGSAKRSTSSTATKSSKHNKNTTTFKETCPSFRRGHLPNSNDVKRLRELSLPHVGSFDYFLEKGLTAGITDIVPLEIDLVNPRKTQQATNSVSAQTARNDLDLDSDDDHSESTEQDPEPASAQGNIITPDRKQVDTLKMWLENIKVSKPVKTDQYSSTMRKSTSPTSGNRLTPRECRELGLMYSGPITGEFCYQINHRTVDEKGEMTEIEGKVCKLQKRFGDMPIMVMSKACHLYGSKPEQLVRMKEEVCIYLYIH